jgi:uncharacterized RDD family membrane protein YckC
MKNTAFTIQNANSTIPVNKMLENYDRIYAIVPQTVMHEQNIYYAGLKLRIAAYFIDLLLVAALLMLIWGTLFLSFPNYQYTFWRIFITAVIVWALYHGFFESSAFQATPGKMFYKLKVMDKRGSRVGLIRASLRFLASFLSILPAGFGIWDLESARGFQAWHDRLFSCYVIQANPDELKKQ